MFILPDDYDLTLESVEKYIPEAEKRLAILKEGFGDDINTVVQNMFESSPELAIAISAVNEGLQLNEFIVKHVSSRGDITRTQDRATRSRKAFQTTGLSKAKRREIARKVVRSKRANPSSTVRGTRKRKKAMKRRAAMGLS